MFFLLSKILDLAVAPLSWSLALLVLAGLLRRRGRWPLLLGGASAGVLVVFSNGWVAERLSRAAEAGAVTTFRPGVTYDAAIVLGGMIDAGVTRRSGEIELTAAADRVTRALELYRQGRIRHVIVTAGNPGLQDDEPSEAEWLAALLERWGVPADRIVVESRSLNTRDNAVNTARVLAERQLLVNVLVTSAAHMPRALGCFRAVGLEPDALPVDRRTANGVADRWSPRASALAESTDVLRELTGRFVYRVVGYTR